MNQQSQLCPLTRGFCYRTSCAFYYRSLDECGIKTIAENLKVIAKILTAWWEEESA